MDNNKFLNRKSLLYYFIIISVLFSYSQALNKFFIRLKPQENDCFQEFYSKKVVGNK